MKTLIQSVAVFALTAPVAFAGAPTIGTPSGQTTGNKTGADVPEISALEGTAALAALAAIVLLAWERRRRAA